MHLESQKKESFMKKTPGLSFVSGRTPLSLECRGPDLPGALLASTRFVMLNIAMSPFEVAFTALAHKSIHDVATGHRLLHLPMLSSMTLLNEAIIDAAIAISATQRSYHCLRLAKLPAMMLPTEAIVDVANTCCQMKQLSLLPHCKAIIVADWQNSPTCFRPLKLPLPSVLLLPPDRSLKLLPAKLSPMSL